MLEDLHEVVRLEGGVTLEGAEVELLLRAESRVEAAASDRQLVEEVLQGGLGVAATPEQVHRAVDRLVDAELLIRPMPGSLARFWIVQ